MTHQHIDVGPCRFLTVRDQTSHLVDVGSGPAVVLVHGSPAWAYAWQYQLEPLTAAGYRANANDLPSSGHSALDGGHYSVQGLSNFLGDLRNCLQIELAT